MTPGERGLIAEDDGFIVRFTALQLESRRESCIWVQCDDEHFLTPGSEEEGLRGMKRGC